MANFGASMGSRQRRSSGVREEVEHARANAVFRCAELFDPSPLRTLLGEDSQVAKVRSGKSKTCSVNVNGPFFRQAISTMPPVAILTVKGCVGLFPERRMLGLPYGLRARTRKHNVAETFQLRAIATVEEFVIVHG